MMRKYSMCVDWLSVSKTVTSSSEVDPEFPTDSVNLKGGTNLLLEKNYQKLHENEENLGERGGVQNLSM